MAMDCTYRLRIPHVAGQLAKVASRISEYGGLIGDVSTLAIARHEAIREICRPGAVESLFAVASSKREGFAAWSLLFYALWHRRHIEGATLPPDLFAAASPVGSAAKR